MDGYNPQDFGPPDAMAGGSQSKHSMEILTESAKKEDPNVDLKEYVKNLVIAIKANKVFLLRMGNTVFVMRPLDETTVEGHIATLDDMNTLQNNIATAFKTLKGLGYTHATGTSSIAGFVRMAKQLGASYTQLPISAEHPVPTYQFDMDL
jgi:hypothetical protein